MTDKKTKLSGALKILIGFVAVMTAFSIISSFTASAVVPRVSVTTASRQPLSYEVSGSAKIVANGGSYIPLSSDYRVSEVNVHAGDKVEAGDILFSYSADDIAKKYRTLFDELSALDAQLEKDKLQDMKSDSDSDSEAEEKELADAKDTLSEAKSDLQKAISDEQKKAKEDYDALEKEYDELISEDSALVTAQRAYEDAELTLSEATDKYMDANLSGNMTDEIYYAYVSATTAMMRAESDLKAAEDKSRDGNTALRKKLDEARKKYHELKNETPENKTDAGEESEKISMARDAVKKAEKSIEEKKYALEKKLKSLEDEKADKAIDSKIDSIDNTLLLQQISDKKEKLSEVKALLDSNGAVVSKVSGVVSSLDAQSGKIGSENDLVSITTSGLYLEGTLTEKSAKLINVGDEINVTYRSGEDPIKCPVTSIGSVDSDGSTKFTMSFERAGAMLGATVDYRISVNLGMFERCIPYQALHYENNEKYVLVIRETEGILGTELKAVRVPVTVEEENGITASITGAITSEDLIIVSSSKPVSDGDKVRYYEN